MEVLSTPETTAAYMASIAPMRGSLLDLGFGPSFLLTSAPSSNHDRVDDLVGKNVAGKVLLQFAQNFSLQHDVLKTDADTIGQMGVDFVSELGRFGDVCNDVKDDELVGWTRISFPQILSATKNLKGNTKEKER